jgi:hypothetical protein
MSGINDVSPSISNLNLDAFGRLRTSLPIALFDSTFYSDLSDIVFTKLTASGGTITHDTNKRAMILSCTTTTNSRSVLQSRQYIPYHPAKSTLIFMTGNFKGAATGVKKYFGQFDADNGFYFLLDGSTLKVGIRSKVSGSIVNTEISQTDWNVDRLDGTDTSKITLDLSKQQIFFIDYQFLGAGRIRYGFCINGDFYYCHQIFNANVLTTLYSQTATLPVRAEILNTGSSASTLEMTCVSVSSEGAEFNGGVLRSVSTGVVYRNVSGTGVNFPLISIRKRTAYVNIPIEIKDAGVFVQSSDECLVQIVIGGTLTAASWVANGDVSEYDISATAITGARVLMTAYARGGVSQAPFNFSDKIQQTLSRYLGSDLQGNSEIMTIVVSNITSLVTYAGYFDYRELV